MKRRITVFAASFFIAFIFSAASAFCQSEEYTSSLKQAKLFESQKKWTYALGAYYDAIMCSDESEVKIEALEGYLQLSDTIKNGKPGYGNFNAFTLHDEWKNLLVDAERYGTEYGKWTLSVSGLVEDELDYENRTASYRARITLRESQRYEKTVAVIQEGYAKAYRSDWKDLPAAVESEWTYAWPLLSASSPVNSNYKPENAAVFSRPVNVYQDYINFNAFADSLVRINDGKGGHCYSTLYDLKLGLQDEENNKCSSEARWLLNGKAAASNDDMVTEVFFKGITAETMELIEAGKVKAVPSALFLQYGKYNPSDDKGGRKFIKSLPEIQISLSKVKVLYENEVENTDAVFESIKAAEEKAAAVYEIELPAAENEELITAEEAVLTEEKETENVSEMNVENQNEEENIEAENSENQALSQEEVSE